jgi:hypothetical protein
MDAVDRFAMKVARRERFMELIKFWVEARKQGLYPCDVDAFGYDGKVSSDSPFRVNYARLKNGERVELTPTLKRVELIKVE